MFAVRVRRQAAARRSLLSALFPTICDTTPQDWSTRGNYSSETGEMHTPGQDDRLNSTPPTPIAWHTVLVEHDRWLRTVVLARVGQALAVDEVMQEVALAAVRQQAPILDASKVAPWLYRLAVIQSLLYRRQQGRRRKLNTQYAERVRPANRTPGPSTRWNGCWPTNGRTWFARRSDECRGPTSKFCC